MCVKLSRIIERRENVLIGVIQLGIPTANIPADDLDKHPDLETGVYYGVVALAPIEGAEKETEKEKQVQDPILPAVLSIGYNPFYKNTVRSVVRFTPPLRSAPPAVLS